MSVSLFWIVIILLLPTLAPIAGWLAHRASFGLAQQAGTLATRAGAWLDHRARELGLAIETLVSNRFGSAYLPTHDLFVLEPQIYYGDNAAAHAVAAHELGHKLIADERATTWIRWGVRAIRNSSLAVAAAFMVGNWLYAMPVASSIALAAWIVALVAMAFDVFEEVAASTIGLHTLRNAKLSRRQRLIASLALLSALATYVAPALVVAGIAWKWSAIEALFGAGAFTELRAAPELLGLLALGASSIWLATAALAPGVVAICGGRFDSRSSFWRGIARLLTGVLVAVLFFMTWDLSTAPWFRLALLVALVPALQTWRLLVGGLLILALALAPYSIARRIVPASHPPKTLEEVKFRALHEARLDEILEGADTRPHILHAGLLYLPFLVAVWIALLL